MNSQSRGLKAVLAAQFFSSLADNALLFCAIAILKENHAPSWHAPLLQEFLLFSYIGLAPFVGNIADVFPKSRVMLFATSLKLAATLAMFLGLNPLLAYALVGIGAAGYSPAKYGILSDLVSSKELVKANGMLEGSNSVAILLGIVMGGYLSDHGTRLTIMFTAVMYGLSILANRHIPLLAPVRGQAHSPRASIKEFFSGTRNLLKNSDAVLGLVGTSILVGTGSTLRFLLVAWVPSALGYRDATTPAVLSAAVAIGIAVGAAAAARFVTLDRLNRAIPAGLAFGLLIAGLADVSSLAVASVVLVAIGACGGFYVVPLKAILQDRGRETVGTGFAISVQNVTGNIATLMMVGAYTGMTHAGLPPIGMALMVGLFIVVCIGGVTWGRGFKGNDTVQRVH